MAENCVIESRLLSWMRVLTFLVACASLLWSSSHLVASLSYLQSSPESESYAFSADINQLLSLIINTFYSNKGKFIRAPHVVDVMIRYERLHYYVSV